MDRMEPADSSQPQRQALAAGAVEAWSGARGAGRRPLSRLEVEALWREHRRWVAAVILAHMPRDAELDDLLQEVAMLVVRSIHTLSDPEAIRPWLRTIAINTARSAARKRTARLRLFRPAADPETLGEVAAAGFGTTAATATDPTRAETLLRGQRVMQAAESLPAAYREPLILRCVRGLSQRQVAEILDLPETTVETRLVRARRMLREQIEREEKQAQSRADAARQRAGAGRAPSPASSSSSATALHAQHVPSSPRSP